MNLAPGDHLDLPTADGAWHLQVAAIYADYGNPKSQIAVDAGALFRHFPDVPHTRLALRVASSKIPALITALAETFGLDGRNLLDQATLKAESTKVFNRTFAVTAALNAFTLGVAGLALLSSLMTLANSRLPQLAPLWAVGVTRRRLALIELVKTMSVAAITALLALPLGLAVAWCLVAIVNVKAFGWRLPFHVFPLHLLKLMGVAMVTSLVASLVPLARLARMEPASLVKIFANER
jgi:putative ABC transport system permease protein